MIRFFVYLTILFSFATFCVFYSRNSGKSEIAWKKEIIISAKHVIRFVAVSFGAERYEIPE
jgi:hypothetical protein